MPLLSKRVNENLNTTNSINQSLQMTAKIIGMFGGGILITILSLKYIVFINCITFIISFICLINIKKMYREPKKEKADNINNKWISGMKFINQNSILKLIIIISIIVNITYGPIIDLDIIWIHKLLHASSMTYSIIEICIILGVILGSIFNHFIKIKSIIKKLFYPIFNIGMSIIVIPIFHNVPITFILILIIGISIGIINITILTFVQKKIPNKLLGRVNGSIIAFSNISIPIGSIIGGIFFNYVGIYLTFIINGLIFLSISLYLMIKRGNLLSLK